ncbi:MAG: outer membrane protein assembly factor BamE [Deltaproteobacteria bacterium]|nr:outer membrane protein assembly factor BamE [Deltaproteobacteria bacterium]
MGRPMNRTMTVMTCSLLRMRQGLSILITMLLLVGCMTVGQSFPVENVSKIEPGQTNRADVLRLFGTPWRTGLEDGRMIWTYAHYKYDLSGQTLARDLVLRFNDDGFVATYSFSSTVPDEAYKP